MIGDSNGNDLSVFEVVFGTQAKVIFSFHHMGIAPRFERIAKCSRIGTRRK